MKNVAIQSRAVRWLGLAAVCLLLGPGSLHWSPDEASAAQPLQGRANKLFTVFLSEFVEVTPGTGRFPQSFRMGSKDGPESERPVRTVTFKHKFAIAKYEVPQNLYEAVMGENPSRWKGPRNSVEMVTWHDAQRFCTRITQRLRDAELIAADEEIRLPTEAEWEYCCRAGTTTAYSFGAKATQPGDTGKHASILNEYAWHTGNAAGNDPPVGALKPNPWGLYDVHGYLWEFVADPWHDDYRGAPTDGRCWDRGRPSPPAPLPGGEGRGNERRTIRGGSWQDRYELLRSSTRRQVAADFKSDALGFRCVKAKTGQ